MMMLVMACAGGLVAGGLLLIVRGAIGPNLAIDQVFVDLHRPRDVASQPQRLTAQLAERAVGSSSQQHRVDLELCERSKSRFAQDRLTWALLGALPGILAVVSGDLIFRLSPLVALLLATVGAVAGWFYAIVDLKSDAEKRRREFKHSLTTFLELVTILMAGGAGVQTALYDAAAIGHGPGFRHIKSALGSAQARREAPWVTLGVLGRRLGITELVAIEASMTLAGDGARVRESLRSRSHAMRDRDRSEQEAEAEAKSETMVLPVAMMFAGFMLLIGYPAIAGLSTT